MRQTPVVPLALLVVVGLVVYLAGRGDDEGVDIQALAREQAQREADRFAQSEAEKWDLDLLARKGLGQELPDFLVSEIVSPGNFWFVGKLDADVGVEIPFQPGRLPLPPSTAEPLNTNPGFLGADSCRSCHQEKYETFIETAHHRTSRIAGSDTISGSFAQGRNQMPTSDPNVRFTMIERDGAFYQRVSFFGWEFEVPFHLIMGSSKMAETYLYWHGEELFQMNCTYWTEPDEWNNSPGYIDGDAAYARPIQAGCLECHVTYADLRKPPNHFTPSSLILGVSCERCHGPGKEHVDFHLANPDEKKARHVIVPSKLPRQEEMDVCGQCHTGSKEPKLVESFQFRPGDRLADHYTPLEGHDESEGSVHTSNQVARLGLSACYQQSEMACVECHNPHKNERGQATLFSKRCLNCHATEHCGMNQELGSRLAENCIDCHMPKRATANLRVETVQGNVFPPLRDHYIRVDRQATDEYMRTIEN